MILSSFVEGDLLAVRIGTDYAASDRFARVSFLDAHSDALCLVDVTGNLLRGTVVSARLMTEDEQAEWMNYGRDVIDTTGYAIEEARGAA